VKPSPQNAAPTDAVARRKAPAVVCYSVDKVPPYDRQFYEAARQGLTRIVEVVVPPREAGTLKTRLIPKLLAALNAEPDKVMFPAGANR